MSCKDDNKDNICVSVGGTFEYQARVEIRDTSGNVTPFDLTGYTVISSIKDEPGGTLIIDLTATITDALNGKFTLSLTDEQTATLQPADGYWDVFFEDSGGKITGPMIRGRASIGQVVSVPTP